VAAQNMPGPEFDVTLELALALLADQHPDLHPDRSGLELVRVTHGWDNVVFRLGADLVVKLPRREAGGTLVRYEHRWLPELAPRLPIPVPVPLRHGVPGRGYPWHWTVCRWFEGELAADAALDDPVREAERLGAFLAALHRPAPDVAPDNPFRALPVASLVPRIARNARALDDAIDQRAVAATIARLEPTPDWAGPPSWVHGDLHTANVIVADGSLAAVIDWGDITSGDPAVDLAVAWMLFDDADRSAMRAAAGAVVDVDDDTWRRGELWALHFALLYLLNSADNSRFARMGSALLATVTG
jgi:aminoglycoside phosphotransferase (APT) family kinase protein